MLKIPAFPTKAQEHRLVQTLETCRQVYNSLLNWHKHDYEVHSKTVSRYQMNGAFPKWRKEFPEIADVHSQVLQNISLRVELAFSAFFRRVKLRQAGTLGGNKAGETPGFPRSKGDGYDSFCYPGASVGYSAVNGGLRLSKITEPNSTIKMCLHRRLVGKVKMCCIHRVGSKWFVCFSVEQEDEEKVLILPPSADTVGLDAGLNSCLALSDGTFIDNPRFFRKEEKALAKAGRKQAKSEAGRRKTKKRSLERRRANKVLSRIHERIRNRRHDFVHQFVHQTARRLVNRFGVIAVEKLNVKGMVRNHCLAKSISDASWSMFRTVLTNKAESAGRDAKGTALREVIAVHPAYTSPVCPARASSACGCGR